MDMLILFGAVLAIIIGLVIIDTILDHSPSYQRRQIAKKTRAAANAIDADAEEARRQMNEIAGQSWRDILP